MNERRKLIAVPVALARALLAMPAAPDEPTDAGSDAAPGADADAGADAGEAAEPAPPSLYLDPPPDAKSKPPTVKEWAAEKDIELARGIRSCTARKVREWMRIRCSVLGTHSIDLVAGKSADVFFSIVTGVDCFDDPYEGQRCSEQVEAVFPIRRGDRRVIQISTRRGGYGPLEMELLGEVVISETWIEGDPGPVVIVGD
jgi:hypothetical protein